MSKETFIPSEYIEFLARVAEWYKSAPRDDRYEYNVGTVEIMCSDVKAGYFHDFDGVAGYYEDDDDNR